MLSSLLVACAACSSGTATTGPAPDGGPTVVNDRDAAGGSDAATLNDGAAGTDSGASTACGTMAGTWAYGGMCGANKCEVAQNGCALHILCNETIDYEGTVTGSTFTYAGKDGAGFVHTCTGSIAGTSLSGSCAVPSSGSCTFTATHF